MPWWKPWSPGVSLWWLTLPVGEDLDRVWGLSEIPEVTLQEWNQLEHACAVCCQPIKHNFQIVLLLNHNQLKHLEVNGCGGEAVSLNAVFYVSCNSCVFIHSSKHQYPQSCKWASSTKAQPEWGFLSREVLIQGCMHAKSLQSCPTLWDPMDCSLPSSSVHGILQARTLEWGASSFSRGSSWPRNWTCISCISCIGRRVLYHQCHLGSQIQGYLSQNDHFLLRPEIRLLTTGPLL